MNMIFLKSHCECLFDYSSLFFTLCFFSQEQLARGSQFRTSNLSALQVEDVMLMLPHHHSYHFSTIISGHLHALLCAVNINRDTSSLATSPEMPRKIEISTREQSSCNEWHLLRRPRITSSKFQEVCHVRGQTLQKIWQKGS